MVKIKIDRKRFQAEEGQTILQAARQAGLTIPTLCDHPDLHPYGGCRLCIVEVEGARLPLAACTTPIYPGMVIKTESPALANARRIILEMLLSNYHDDALENNGSDQPANELIHWAKHYHVDIARHTARAPRYSTDSDPNPFIKVDLNKCIICTRCIRACADIQGRFVWSLANRGNDVQIIAGAGTNMIDGRCESCGACVAYCPTGALENRMSDQLGIADRSVTTTCGYCGVGCQFNLEVKDNRVIRVVSQPNSAVNGMHLCVKGRYGYDYIHHPDRLLRPKVRKYLLEGKEKPSDRGEWQEVDWETALSITVKRLTEIRDQSGSNRIGVLTSAKCLNEENYLMNKFARQVIGTNSIDHCARL
jgi:predicted molibdopterin-dependent oxidoreductase YjgC